MIYIGRSENKTQGLRSRLSVEWVGGEVGGYDSPAWVSLGRMCSRLAAIPWVAICDHPRSSERDLLDLVIGLTGHLPIVNRGAWR